MMDKTFDPAAVEARIAARWEEADAFKAGRAGSPARRDRTTIVIPPPNVTGSLHMGHALNNTLQDILCRFERMRGRDVLWQPGTDHAGIATQMVVERQLMERQMPTAATSAARSSSSASGSGRRNPAAPSGSQLKRLGASCDWSRERFTMDEGLSRAVLKVFVDLYQAGPDLQGQAPRELGPEVPDRDLRPRGAAGRGEGPPLAHPLRRSRASPTASSPSRRRVPRRCSATSPSPCIPTTSATSDLVGKIAILPLVGRRIPIVADEYSDPEKGTGAVKITPAHDFNDFEVGRRHDLPLDQHPRAGRPASISRATRPSSAGVEPAPISRPSSPSTASTASRRASASSPCSRSAAFSMQIEPHAHTVPHGDRSGVVDRALSHGPVVREREAARRARARRGARRAKPRSCPRPGRRRISSGSRTSSRGASRASSGGAIRSRPGTATDGDVFVALTEEEARAAGAREAWPRRSRLRRDEDVLDTWFSSALWPFSTLGWPDETPELRRYYPTNTLVTGFDIIFFWVARMMMMGLHFMDEVPFRDRLHPRPRPRREGRQDVEVEGQRHRSARRHRSVRRRCAALHARRHGGAGARHQAVRAARRGLPQLRDQDLERGALRRDERLRARRRLRSRSREGDAQQLGARRGATRRRRGVARHRGLQVQRGGARRLPLRLERLFCDWTLELAKPVLQGGDEPAKDETRATIAHVLDEICKLLHPFMPFLTEELWAIKGEGPARGRPGARRLAVARRTSSTEGPRPRSAGSSISSARSAPPGRRRTCRPAPRSRSCWSRPSGETRARLDRWSDTIRRLARISEIAIADAAPPQLGPAHRARRGGGPAARGHCRPRGRARTPCKRRCQKLDADVAKIDAKLGNADFLKRAREEVVDEQRERREEAEARKRKVGDALSRLQAA